MSMTPHRCDNSIQNLRAGSAIQDGLGVRCATCGNPFVALRNWAVNKGKRSIWTVDMKKLKELTCPYCGEKREVKPQHEHLSDSRPTGED
jgi:DNA-directed RNA polymerase subunit RPC12/RpoP